MIEGRGYQLHLGDCLDVMRGFSDKQFQVCVTDPPYGIGENRDAVMSRGTSTKKWKRGKPIDYGEFEWDNQTATAEQIARIMAVSKNQIIFGGNYFVLPPSPCWIVWDKMNGESDFADCELAWTSYKTAVRKFTYLWSGFLKAKPEQRYHPTQKPLSLMKWVIENYTKHGDTILDPFAGSFTTGVACLQTGRQFVGIEKDPRYFEIGVKRMHDAAQHVLLPGM